MKQQISNRWRARGLAALSSSLLSPNSYFPMNAVVCIVRLEQFQSPLTTWGFLVYFRLLQTLWCKWLPCSVGEKFKYFANEDTGMPPFISNSDIPPLFGSNRNSLTLSGWISFSLRLIFCVFLFWAYLDSELFNSSGIQFTLSSYFSYNSCITTNLFCQVAHFNQTQVDGSNQQFSKMSYFFLLKL